MKRPTNGSRISLQALARRTATNPLQLQRWVARGILRATNHGRGRAGGITFTRDQALEGLAVLALRRVGVPLQRLRPLVVELRRRGWQGADFLQVGSHGRVALVDGDGARAPLCDPRTGQTHLSLVLDLRAMRAQAECIVADLAGDQP